MSQLKKIKFSSIEDFKNAATNGELNNETIWITPEEDKEEIIVATINDGTGISVNINGTNSIIYVPLLTDSIIQTLGSSTKPRFVYYDGQICNVIGGSADTLVMLYYDYANLTVLKLLYYVGFSDPLETTVLGGNGSQTYQYSAQLSDDEILAIIDFSFSANELILNREDFENYVKNNFEFGDTICMGMYSTPTAYHPVCIKYGGLVSAPQIIMYGDITTREFDSYNTLIIKKIG